MASHGRGENNEPRRDRVQVVFVLSPKCWFFELLQIWKIAGKKEAPCPQCKPASPCPPCRGGISASECIFICLSKLV